MPQYNTTTYYNLVLFSKGPVRGIFALFSCSIFPSVFDKHFLLNSFILFILIFPSYCVFL